MGVSEPPGGDHPVKGYDSTAYRPGELAVVLARYEGQQKAADGRDIVMLQQWQ